ncbi:glucoamylase family protein [Gramella sp. AN32]|uniref:Glucoamylase family protein n=1 Tax=Christiangramia antarctica TaxID=2058158 RepID=A0ABW5X5F2_9FLAO|nr:glucoamylase family protein [Gramella sp. AN32]MCM4157211.1 hypothetical protein [Gramella sp. AN32]
MKKESFIFVLLLLPFINFGQEPEYNKTFFDNSLMENSWFYSEVSYSIPSFVLNVEKRLPLEKDVAFTPGNSLSLNYTSSEGGTWEVNLKYPKSRGKDFLKESKTLSFWIYTPENIKAEILPEIALNIGNSTSDFLPFSKYFRGDISEKWIQVKIPVSDFGIRLSSDEISGLKFRQNGTDGLEHQIFLDQVEFLSEQMNAKNLPVPEILSSRGYERHVDIAWNPVGLENVRYIKVYRSQDDKNYTAVGIQDPLEFNLFTDFTGVPDQKYHYKISALGYDYAESNLSESSEAETRQMNDEELLDMVQEAAFRYYWDGAEENSGLALENIPGRKNMIATGASGFGLMALIVGAEKGFIQKDEFLERIEKVVDFIEKSDRFHGAVSHFIDGPSGKVEPFFGEVDNGADLVETSFFMQGLVSVGEYLSEDISEEKILKERINRIWEAVEWDWFKKTEDSKFLYWHWSPDHNWQINHQLIGWNETMITYFMAIASPTHGISPEMYYTGWANQDQVAQDYRSNWGKTLEGSMFTNGTNYFGIPLKVGVSNGGPLFFTHYSFLGLDPHKMEDKYTNYFDNNQDIAKINYRYCVENPNNFEGLGKDSWGLTASDGPWGYKAREPKQENDDGTMAPTGAISSFPYTPEKSMAALKHFYRDNGKFLWGEYGFRDAFNLTEDWVAEIFMGLNQAPMVVMIENYRSGLLWNLFMKNKDVQQAISKIKQTE